MEKGPNASMFLKLKYIKPDIVKVDLDSDISLHLASEPPTFNNENVSHLQDSFHKNFFSELKT